MYKTRIDPLHRSRGPPPAPNTSACSSSLPSINPFRMHKKYVLHFRIHSADAVRRGQRRCHASPTSAIRPRSSPSECISTASPPHRHQRAVHVADDASDARTDDESLCRAGARSICGAHTQSAMEHALFLAQNRCHSDAIPMNNIAFTAQAMSDAIIMPFHYAGNESPVSRNGKHCVMNRHHYRRTLP